jgi:hypothetical protein
MTKLSKWPKTKIDRFGQTERPGLVSIMPRVRPLFDSWPPVPCDFVRCHGAVINVGGSRTGLWTQGPYNFSISKCFQDRTRFQTTLQMGTVRTNVGQFPTPSHKALCSWGGHPLFYKLFVARISTQKLCIYFPHMFSILGRFGIFFCNKIRIILYNSGYINMLQALWNTLHISRNWFSSKLYLSCE